MSVHAIAAVKARRVGSTAKKVLLLVLADYADESWSCFPSQHRLAEETELGERTVRRLLSELERDGLVERRMRRDVEGRRATDRIVVVRSVVEALDPVMETQPAIMAGGELATDDEPVATKGEDQPATDARQPAIECGPTGQPMRTNRPTNADQPAKLWPGNRQREPTTELLPPPPPQLALAMDASSGEPDGGGEVATVFEAWKRATGRTDRVRLDAKRRRRIANALREYPLDDVLDAVQGWRNSPHHCGQNERATVYNDLDLLLRDAAHIEKFRDLARSGPTPVVSPTRAALARWAAGEGRR